MDEKIFKRVGARNIEITAIGGQIVEGADNAYCPCCGGGPLNGVTGVFMRTDDNNNNNNNNNNDDDNDNNDFGFFDCIPDMPEIILGESDPSFCCYCAAFLCYCKKGDVIELKEMSKVQIKALKDNPDYWNGMMKMKDIVETSIENAKLAGDRRYAGKCKKSVA